MSKLLEKLRRAVRGEPPRPLGFGRVAADAAPVAPLVLIARLADWDPDLAGRLKSAGFDLLLLPARDKPPAGSEAEVLSGLTWGVELPGTPAPDLVEAYFGAGADFVVLDAGAPAELLSPDGGRYLALTPELPDAWLRALDFLPVEGFWLRATPPGDRFTVADLLTFVKFAAIARKPVVYEPGRLPAPAELPALRDAGVVGLALPATAENLDALAQLRAAVAELPRRRPSAAERPAVTVPPPTAGAAAPTSPAPEPDEEDEEE